jgi:hypothetical protein
MEHTALLKFGGKGPGLRADKHCQCDARGRPP